LWPVLLILSAAVDANASYVLSLRGFRELNPLVSQLASAIGAAPAYAIFFLLSALSGLFLLYSSCKPVRAVGVAYAATRWIPAAHNLLLLLSVEVQPVATLLAYSVGFAGVFIYSLRKIRISPKC